MRRRNHVATVCASAALAVQVTIINSTNPAHPPFNPQTFHATFLNIHIHLKILTQAHTDLQGHVQIVLQALLTVALLTVMLS